MNPNKTKQLAEKMGWKLRIKPKSIKPGDCWMIGDQLVIYPAHGKSRRYWNPETRNADMVELMERLLKTHPCGFTIHGQGEGFGIVAKEDVYAPTLRAAVVSFACKVWGIEE